MLTKPELITLAKKVALEHVVDGAAVCAVVEQESNWNTSATRYEPEFRRHYIEPLRLADDAEEVKRSTSFGLMQVMGQVARELGFDGNLDDLCRNPELGLEYGCKKLRKCYDKYNRDELAAFAAYNGGGNPLYAPQVQERMRKYW